MIVLLLVVAMSCPSSCVELFWTPERSNQYCNTLPKTKPSQVTSEQSPIVGSNNYICMRLIGQNVIFSPVDFLEIMFGRLYGGDSSTCDTTGGSQCNGIVGLQLPFRQGFNFTFWWSAGSDTNRFVIAPPIGPIIAAFNFERAVPLPNDDLLYNSSITAPCELLADTGFFAIEASLLIRTNKITIKTLITTYQSGVEAQFSKVGIRCVIPQSQSLNDVGNWSYGFESSLKTPNSKALHDESKSQVGLSHMATDTYQVDYKKGIYSHASHLTYQPKPGNEFCDQHEGFDKCKAPCEWIPLRGCKFNNIPIYDSQQPVDPVPDNYNVTVTLQDNDYSCCSVSTHVSVCYSPPCQSKDLIWFNSTDDSSTISLTLPECSDCQPASLFTISSFNTLTSGGNVVVTTGTAYYSGKLLRIVIPIIQNTTSPSILKKEEEGDITIIIILVICSILLIAAIIGMWIWYRKRRNNMSDSDEEDNEVTMMEGLMERESNTSINNIDSNEGAI